MKARVLALLLGLVLFDTGCILSPDIEEDVPASNHAPEIVLESLEPSPASIVTVGEIDCGPVSFKAHQIRDPDVDDELQAGWFIDATDAKLAEGPEGGWRNIFRTGNELRNGPEFEINTSFDDTSDAHTLYLVIVDRPAQFSEEDGVFEFPGDPDGMYDAITWTFEISEECLR